MTMTQFSNPKIVEQAELFSSLGHETRVNVLRILGQQSPSSLGFLCRVLDKSENHVSHHVKILQNAGLVNRYQSGRHAAFTIAVDKLDSMILLLGSMRPNAPAQRHEDNPAPT